MSAATTTTPKIKGTNLRHPVAGGLSSWHPQLQLMMHLAFASLYTNTRLTASTALSPVPNRAIDSLFFSSSP